MRKRSFLTSLFLVAVLAASALPWRSSADTFVLNTDDGPPFATPDMTGYHNRLIIEALRRLGHETKVLMVPSQRALINADRGIDDGTLPRIAGLEKSFPSLKQVPEKIMDYEFTAFTLRDDITINGWADLKPYSLAYVHGWKLFEDQTAAFPYVTRTRQPEQLFFLLQSRRADIVLLERWQGLYLARKLGIKGVRALAPPLARRDMFVYLNKRHAGMVPALADTLRVMKTDGGYDRITGETLTPLLAEH